MSPTYAKDGSQSILKFLQKGVYTARTGAGSRGRGFERIVGTGIYARISRPSWPHLLRPSTPWFFWRPPKKWMAGTSPAMTMLEIARHLKTSWPALCWPSTSSLVFQRFNEPSANLNFRLDAAWSHQYGGHIPIRLRGVLQAKLDVNGDGAPRAGFASLFPGDVWRRPPSPLKGLRMESSVASLG
jgi:hypothetical protein